MQVQIQQPWVSGVDQSLPVTQHPQSFSNADSAGKVLREVAVDYVQRKAGAGCNPIVAHICRKSTHRSVVDWNWKWSGPDVFMGRLVGQKARKRKHSLSLISENDLDLMFLWDALLDRRQESVNTAYPWLVKRNWRYFGLMRHTHSDFSLTTDT